MRTFYLILCLILSFTLLNAQNLLKPVWKFQTGDNPEWAKIDFNDNNWPEIIAGTAWEQQGYAAYDGYAWYRTTVIFPSSLKTKALKNEGFLLRLGQIDDVDCTFFNSDKLGQTGDFPPNYKGKYNVDREYPIPGDKIRWDQPNVIAVRVFDNGGSGGLATGVAELTIKGLADKFKISVALTPPDHIFQGISMLKIPVKIENDTDENISGKMTLKIKSDFGEDILSIEQNIKINKNAPKSFAFDAKGLKPGFYQASILFESFLYNKSFPFAIGVDPEKVISPPDAPADFENYWARAKKELAAVDPQFKTIKIDSLCSATKDLFLIEMRSLGNVLVRGWYSVPKKPGQHPAILHVQGYSSVMQPAWINSGDDFIDFGLNIRGHGNSQDNVNPGFPGYLQHHLDDKEVYIYRGAYMDCVRAMDFLCSRPEVDTSRIAVEGGSQGGALSFATAALDNKRVKLCAPAVPFLSDFRDYFKVAAWPGGEFVNYVKDHPEIGWEKVYHTLSYIDIKNLAPWIKAPLFMFVGLRDNVCPPHINFAAYNNLNVERQYKAYPYSGHGLPGDAYQVKMDWIRKKFRMN